MLDYVENSTNSMTVLSTLLTHSPKNLVKKILKKQLFKVFGNDPKDIQQMKKHSKENLLKLAKSDDNL